MRRLAVVLSLALTAACGDSYVLTEAEGIEAARGAFIAHNIYPSSTRPFGPIMLDEVAIEFTVDGWSLADKLGFEYVAEGDPDFSEAVTDLGATGEQPRLQAAVDLALEEEPGVHILVLRTWGHETADLAKAQLAGAVDAWLTSQGR